MALFFGYPGESNYSEFWHDNAGRRYVISRHGHYDCRAWTAECEAAFFGWGRR
jgi:hypothetical protein